MRAKKNAPPAATGRGNELCKKQPAYLTPLCPRQSRLLAALIRGPLSREELDRVAGCSNAPDLVASLRRRGFVIPCEKTRVIDRDGRKCWPGIYSLTPADREVIARWHSGGAHG